MAIWKKVITSGSAAELASLSLDTDLSVLHGGTGLSATSASAFLVGTGTTTFTLVGSNGTGQVLRNFAVGAIVSGSFSGSFFGDGSGLTGVSSAPVFKLSGSSAGVDFNAATDTLRFAPASTHGFDMSMSFASTTKTISLITPQDLRNTARPTFAAVNGGFLTGSNLQLSALASNVSSTTALVLGAGNDVQTRTIDSRVFGSTLIDGAGDATRVAYFSDANTLTSAATFTFGSNILTVNGSTFGQDVVIAGNLTVNGTTVNLNFTNANVEDRFILLNSGSATGDGGIVVQTETTFSGSAFGWIDSFQRWGFQFNTPFSPEATAMNPDAFVAAVVDVDGGETDIVLYQKNGNIKIQSGEIYIYA